MSLRPPVAGRTLLSAAIPIANLMAATLLLSGLVATLVSGPAPATRVAAIAAIFLLSVIGLRASFMTSVSRIADWPQAFAVAAAYEAGRALALAGRFGYRRRRRAAIA